MSITLQQLKANPKNPRKISDEKLQMLKASIDRFGDLSGFVYNRKTKRLAGGHQRQKVLPPSAEVVIDKTYKKPTQVGTIATGWVEIGTERFGYREVMWDEATELAANIAANKHGGEFDLSLLTEALLDLDAANFDLNLTGFNAEELEDLMAPPGEKQSPVDASVEFTKELDDRNDYIVLMFDSKEEFSEACKKLGIGPVKMNLSSTGTPTWEMAGIGRIVDGKKTMKRFK